MALVLVVTIVSVSAAWFGDTLSVTNDIMIKTELPEGQIVIDTSGAINKMDDKLVPAIVNKGYMLTGAGLQNLNVLDSSLVGANKPLESIAQTVYVYFPIFGIGVSSSQDMKLAAVVSLDGAYILKDSAHIIDNNYMSSVDYMDNLILKMEVVTDVHDEEVTDPSTGTKYMKTVSTPVASTPLASLTANDRKVFWGYSSELNEIGILMDQGVNCYIKLSVTFSKVDEELPPELLDTLIRINVGVPQKPTREEVIAIEQYDRTHVS